jgi:hypothetical protein
MKFQALIILSGILRKRTKGHYSGNSMELQSELYDETVEEFDL